MNPTVIKRKNRLFCIDVKTLPEAANTTPVKGALYAAIHEEYKGAAYSDKYQNLTAQQRMQSINDFAWTWLLNKGFK